MTRDSQTGRFTTWGTLIQRGLARSQHSPTWKLTQEFERVQDRMDDCLSRDFQILETTDTWLVSYGYCLDSPVV